MTRLEEEVRLDIAAFADRDEDVLLGTDGTIVFVRNGSDVTCRLEVEASGRRVVHVEDETFGYREFVTHYLARLDVLAERLLSRRSDLDEFVNGPARLERAGEDPIVGRAVDLLDEECQTSSPFASRVLFLTADAGFGKTALLRHYQARQARRFLRGESAFLFWHVDLQGRQLLRLSEALMGDLADLRVSGIWMPGVIRLLRMGAIVLAIDGFDELAAEQGSSDALGALANLVGDLEGEGKVVAASRRTFFDTDSYLRRAGLLRRHISAPAEFDQLALLPWGKEEALELLSRLSEEKDQRAEAVYAEIQEALGGESEHPMLTRPFLLNLIARAILLYDVSAGEFIRGMEDPMSGVAAVVEAFVKREVAEKWRHRETGQPYLTSGQHMDLLAGVAEEMHLSQKDRLPLDTVETIAALHLENWGVAVQTRPQIMEMFRMHVLLNPPPDGDMSFRSFDHPEFRDYFIAYWLRSALIEASDGNGQRIGHALSVASITDSTARYITGILGLSDERRRKLVEELVEVAEGEWRPSHLQTNVGTLIPYLIDDLDNPDPLVVKGGIVLSSLAFEGKTLSNVTFEACTFVNVSLDASEWSSVRCRQCNLGFLTINVETCSFSEVTLEDSKLEGVRFVDGEGEAQDEYAPDRIAQRLESLGVGIGLELPLESVDVRPESERSRLMRRLLRIFRRSTFVTDSWLQTKLGAQAGMAIADLIPALEEHGVLEEGVWRGQGQQRVWTLQMPLEEVLAADSMDARGALAEMWKSLRS